MARLRLAFMGSPAFSVPALRALREAGHEIAAVYAQPPRPARRGQREQPCPVHHAAVEMGSQVRTPASLRRDPDVLRAFAELDLDAAVVAAYGLILPPGFLTAPRRGCLNIHASLLPRWRGASPIQSAVLAGDPVSGVTIMQMDAGLDTGPMLLHGEVQLGPRVTASALHDTLSELGARLIVRALDEAPPPVPQPAEGASYAPKLARDDGRLDWTRDAAALDRQVRALNPWPGTFTALDGGLLKVLEAEPVEAVGAPGEVLTLPGLVVGCGAGALRLLRVQVADRAAMDVGAFLNGRRVPAGARLGDAGAHAAAGVSLPA